MINKNKQDIHELKIQMIEMPTRIVNTLTIRFIMMFIVAVIILAFSLTPSPAPTTLFMVD